MAKHYTFLAPEVLQISSMDCGVAALSCLAKAYGCGVSYERLREACQTGVDGTSIDSLEDVALSLGIDLIQHVVPKDLALETLEGRLPCIAIVRHEAGIPHFVVVWRAVGPFLQIMNPAGGREWVLRDRFLSSLFMHTHRMGVDDFLEWWPTSTFAESLEASGVRALSGQAREVLKAVRGASAVSELSAADTALRLLKFAQERGLVTNRDDTFMRLYAGCVQGYAEDGLATLPKLRSIGPAEQEEDRVGVTGVILLAPPERNQPRKCVAIETEEVPTDDAQTKIAADAASLRSDEVPESLARTLWTLLDVKHRILAIALLVTTAVFVPVAIIETFIYRAAADAGQLFDSSSMRFQASMLVLSFFVILFALERLSDWGGRRLGAYLELRLRLSVLRAMPRVDEQFVRSRPTTDLAYRAQALSQGRSFPSIFLGIFRTTAELLVAMVALASLEPWSIPIVFVGGLALASVSYGSIAALREVGVRFQAHAARMLLMFLDALRGIRPVRTHGFQGALRRDYERELAGWKRTSENEQQVGALFGAVDALVGVLVTAGCLYIHVARHPDIRGFVLLAFWAFRVPGTLSALISLFQGYPGAQLALSRILEVTRYAVDHKQEAVIPLRPRGVDLSFRGVSVKVSGRMLLDTFSLDIPAGQHVAIVGPSGAGKSSLLSLLLGLLRTASGRITANDTLLTEETYPSLRAATSWVDPSTQLWNQSLLANVEYATSGVASRSLEDVLIASNLFPVVDNLAEGLGTKMGWDGAFVSGGEGQRVRIARALLRAETKLAVLDEPFRGLDRNTRRRMLNEARRLWLNATMVFVSHDIGHALDFDRVLVVEDGKIVEDGHPLALRQEAGTRFRALLDAEEKAKNDVWHSQEWRRLRLKDGALQEGTS